VNDINLYEKFLTASEAIRSNYQYGSKRAFFLGNELLSALKYATDEFVPYSTLPGLEDLKTDSGGFYLGELAPHALIVTEPIFENGHQNDMRLKVLGIRLLQLLNIKELIIIGKGEPLKNETSEEHIFWAEDHINLSGNSPLVGENIDKFGERFPDMTGVYDTELTSEGIKVTENLGLKIKKGVWATSWEDNYVPKNLIETLFNNNVNVISNHGMQEVIAAAQGNIKTALTLIVNQGDKHDQLLYKMLKSLSNGSN